MFGKYSTVWEKAYPYQDKRNDAGHAEIVTKYTRKLCTIEKADKNVAIPAAILHDIGWSQLSKDDRLLVFKKEPSQQERLRVRLLHQTEGVKLAKEILYEVKYPGEYIPQIIDIISEHDTREGYKSKEEAVMRDADKLWRVSEIGFYKDCKESRISGTKYYDILKKKIDKGLLFLDSAKTIALKELEKRKSENFKHDLF